MSAEPPRPGLREREATDWKCCGCGKPSPDQRRNCNCPTGVLYREGTRDHACKIEPDIEPQARATADAERLAEATERLQAIIDWADLALKLPHEFDSHGVRNLDGPVFDEARAFLSAHKLPGAGESEQDGGEG